MARLDFRRITRALFCSQSWATMLRSPDWPEARRPQSPWFIWWQTARSITATGCSSEHGERLTGRLDYDATGERTLTTNIRSYMGIRAHTLCTGARKERTKSIKNNRSSIMKDLGRGGNLCLSDGYFDPSFDAESAPKSASTDHANDPYKQGLLSGVKRGIKRGHSPV